MFLLFDWLPSTESEQPICTALGPGGSTCRAVSTKHSLLMLTVRHRPFTPLDKTHTVNLSVLSCLLRGLLGEGKMDVFGYLESTDEGPASPGNVVTIYRHRGTNRTETWHEHQADGQEDRNDGFLAGLVIRPFAPINRNGPY